MNIDLELHGDKISVKCAMQIPQSECQFSLNNLLKITKIRNNEADVKITSEQIMNMPFQPTLRQYLLGNLVPGVLCVEYEGCLNGNFLFMEENIRLLGFYNAWYPLVADDEETYEVTVHADDRYELIQGVYDPENGTWAYSTKNQNFVDCHIMLINREKACKLTVEHTDIWYFHKEQEKAAQALFHGFSQVYEFYRKLYGHGITGKSIIVLLPEKYKGMGAYQRTGLTVFAEVSKNTEWLLHVLFHELGHNYATGAPYTSWEDWLNETHAEWSALLYWQKYHPAFFEQLMREKRQRYTGTYCLKPDGENRPQDVHLTGTLIYGDIFQQFGADAITTLLQTFDELKLKDTAHFMQALKEKNKALHKMLLPYIYSPHRTDQ